MGKWVNRIAFLVSILVVVGLIAWWQLFAPSGEANPFQNGWLIYPNGGTELQGIGDAPGDPASQRSDLVVSGVVTILWDNERVDTPTVSLLWSTDERLSHHIWPDSESCWSPQYHYIIKGYPNTGSYDWDTVEITEDQPELNGKDTWHIKIFDADGAFFDASNAYFTVQN